MLSKFITRGVQVELQAVDKRRKENNKAAVKIYTSQVYQVLSEDKLEILMPIEQGKLILLSTDTEYNAVFYGQTGLYQCFIRMLDRYKSNNISIFAAELISNLRKFQRREYYRFSCALEMSFRILEGEELEVIRQKKSYVLTKGLPLKRSIIVDMSGGGLRFLSNQRYEPENLIYCSYHLLREGEKKLYQVVGQILNVKELKNHQGMFEHRVQYVNIDETVREEIIKFIFEQERKNRKKELLEEN